jgi:ribose transport system substrate-binding protein
MKKTILVISCTIMLLIVAACGPAATTAAPSAPTQPAAVQPAVSSAKYTIAIVPPALTSPYFITLANAAKDAAAKNPNIDLSVVAPSAETAIDEQVKIVEDLTQKKVNMIAISTSNWDALTPSLKAARAAGIEIVGIDRVIPLPGVDIVSMLGVDEVAGGELVGNYVVQTLNGKGNVAILEGVTGDYWSQRRGQGFHNVVDKVPGIKVETTQPANWDRATGMSTMENILQAHSDLNLVWGLNDNMAIGALTAVTAAKLNSQILVVGYNGDKEALQDVAAGTMIATVKQQPAVVAQTIVDTIATALMNGQRSSLKPVYYIPTQLVTKDNVSTFLTP